MYITDGTRSVHTGLHSGPNGQYNYEYTVNLDLIGRNVAGHYTIWVLDGNGLRDSASFQFNVPEEHGEIWIEFDQS